VTLAELVEHNDALMGNLVTVTDVVIETDPDRYNEVAIGAGVKLALTSSSAKLENPAAGSVEAAGPGVTVKNTGGAQVALVGPMVNLN